MRAILLPIHPQHCNNILSGKKLVEIRKTKPKLETPFKCYIYQTKTKRKGFLSEYDTAIIKREGNVVDGSQMVIGEFICTQVEKFTVGSLRCDYIEKLACLSFEEIIDYFYKPEELDGNHVKFGYAWHISNLKIYDEPKPLSDFTKFGYCHVGGCCGNTGCKYYINHGYYEPPQCAIDGCFLSKPPQSYCYVEELQ